MRTILSTKRCVLASLIEEDYGAVMELYRNPKVRQYLGGAISAEQVQERFAAVQIHSEYLALSIHIRESREFAGLITIAPHHDGEDTEISFQLLPNFWGKGYATEACSAVLGHAFTALGMNWIVAETQAVNDQARALLARLGMNQIGEIERFGSQNIIYAITNQQGRRHFRNPASPRLEPALPIDPMLAASPRVVRRLDPSSRIRARQKSPADPV